jgi:hypothetical protein
MVYYLIAQELLAEKGQELKKDRDVFTPEIETEDEEE